ncbi:PDDEXK family nuclease [Bacillus paralicheniformis]|uniref:hypothetical protein n=1 Tax=Bacillus paralicheniformis TaxID=1648923 RepID=UPI00164932C0|nr:hypothetical protein [Bacillus paralicheniformis]
MIKIAKLKHNVKHDYWYYSGSSEVFDTRDEALKRLKKRAGIKRSDKKFYSEKLDMTFRSSWEVELAEIMTELGIKWEFEPRRFYFHAEKESYLPDFYLPEFNCWIEVKGFFDLKSQRRMKLFSKYYGADYSFFLFMKDERKMVLDEPETLFTFIEIAQSELERRQGG